MERERQSISAHAPNFLERESLSPAASGISVLILISNGQRIKLVAVLHHRWDVQNQKAASQPQGRIYPKWFAKFTYHVLSPNDLGMTFWIEHENTRHLMFLWSLCWELPTRYKCVIESSKPPTLTSTPLLISCQTSVSYTLSFLSESHNWCS